MRTMITLSSLGLTLALGLASAAHARPGDRYAHFDGRGSGFEQNQNYYLHKRYYRHDQNRARSDGSGSTRLPDSRGGDGVGEARPEVREPMIRPEPAVWHELLARERAHFGV
jgi:hypothetical protein